MKYVDVIGIGAINYDYMFKCKKSYFKKADPDGGIEKQGVENKKVEEEIKELARTSKSYTTQIGGSALLAIKAIKYIDDSLSVGFVGVCGEASELEKSLGKNLNIESEISFIDNDDWLFRANSLPDTEYKYIGKAAVKLNSNVRGNIEISNSANDLIIQCIKKKEEEKGESLAEYLAQAKWIHISSLGKFEYFEEIMKYVLDAQKLNRFLKVSIDPGYQFTDDYNYEIQKYLKTADYIFLNQREFDNLVINENLSDNDKYIKLSAYFNDPHNVNTKVFIIKHKNRHELIDFVNGVPYVYYHTTLPFYKIINDTGAGDCFAGGFICGLLSDRLLSQQPAPISLGVLAAKVRMTSKTNNLIFKNIAKESEEFFEKKYKNGEFNRYQKVIMFIQSHTDIIITNIITFIVTFIISYLCAILTK